MKRRLAAMGLAVAVLAGVLEFGVDPADSQTATPTPEPLGSISGRAYVDVDANNSFGRPDVPLEFPLVLFLIDVSGPPLAIMNSGSDGTFHFNDLPAGNYQLFIDLPIASCVAPSSPYTWVGDAFFGLKGCNMQLTTSSRDITLMAGENVMAVDFPQLPPSYDVTARIWLNAAPLSATSRVTITAGGRDCWNAQVNPTLTAAGVPVSFYLASLAPSSDPACQGGDLGIGINDQPADGTTPWDDFWRGSLFSFAPGPLYLSSDPFPFVNSTDLSMPTFLGISGQAVEAGTVTPETVSKHTGVLVADGTEIRSFVGTILCGSARTKALTTTTGGFGGNLFGLIVPPASVKDGCGTAGAPVTFCIGDFKATQPAAGPFSGFVSPQAVPVQWGVPPRADITLEPTTEPCLASAAPSGIAPEPLPASLPRTGGSPAAGS